MIDFDGLTVGDQLPTLVVALSRENLVRYAGASLDFNPIHWNPRFATDVGLPDVIAHGMLTMAIAARAATDWVGDPGAVVDYAVRFTRPVVVPDPAGAEVEVTGKVRSIGPDRLVELDLAATSGGQTVLARARVTVRVP